MTEDKSIIVIRMYTSVLLSFSPDYQKLPEVKKITEKAAEIKAILPDYDVLNKNQRLFNENKCFINDSSEIIGKNETKIKTLGEEIASLTDENKSLEKIGETKLKLETEKKNLQDEKNKLEKLNANIEDAEKQRKKYEEAVFLYSQKQKSSEILDAEFKEKTRIYLEAQAGILAETLEANKPCPVCGSISHPKLAGKPVDVPTKEELDTMQDNFAKANTIANNARAEAGKLKGASDEKNEGVLKEIISLLGNVTLNDAKSLKMENRKNRRKRKNKGWH